MGAVVVVREDAGRERGELGGVARAEVGGGIAAGISEDFPMGDRLGAPVGCWVRDTDLGSLLIVDDVWRGDGIAVEVAGDARGEGGADGSPAELGGTVRGESRGGWSGVAGGFHGIGVLRGDGGVACWCGG